MGIYFNQLRNSRIIYRDPPDNYSIDDKSIFCNQMKYSTLDCNIYTISGGYINSMGIIYDRNFRLFSKSIVPTQSHKYYQYNYLFKKLIFSKRKQRISGNLLSVIDEWSIGHFHWISDVLPKIMCLDHLSSQYILLLPNTDYIHRIAVPSIERMGIYFKDIIFLDPKKLYLFENISYISNVAKSGQMDDEIMLNIKSKFIDVNLTPKSKLYITRRSSKFRKILNEEEVIDIVKEFGFEIVESDYLSFQEHLNIFQNASCLVSIHGAGLTNSLFMQCGTSLGEFIINKFSDNRCYYHLTKSMKMKYYYFFGIPDSNKPIEGKGSNISIEKNLLKKFLSAINY